LGIEVGGSRFAGYERTAMRFLAALLAVCALCLAAQAETADCKGIADPAARLTCYDKINPPVASYPLPLPKPSRPLPLATNPDGTRVYTDSSGGGDDAEVTSVAAAEKQAQLGGCGETPSCLERGQVGKMV
jgi:hypothetical protein